MFWLGSTGRRDSSAEVKFWNPPPGAGDATLLYYMSEEAREGKQAFIERREPDFNKFPRLP